MEEIKNIEIVTDEVAIENNDVLETNEVTTVEDTVVVSDVVEEVVEDVIDYGVYTDVDDDIVNSTHERFVDVPKMMYSDYYTYALAANEIPENVFSTNVNLALSSLSNMNSKDTMVSHTAFREFKYTDKEVVSKLTKNDDVVEPRTVVSKSTNKKENFKSKIKKITRSGSIVQIPLVNSGFQVTLNIPNNNELYAIRKELRELAVTTEINTGGFLFNNTKIAVIKKVLDFIFTYIIDTTLDMPDNDTNIYDYIVSEDYPLLIMGISMSLYPNGNTTSVTCKNTYVLKNNIPTCDFIAYANLSVKDTLKIKNDRITDNMFIILNKKFSSSVTMEEYKTYQRERLEFTNYDNKVTFENDGSSVVFVLGSKVINEYLEIGSLWIADLETKLYSLGDVEKEDRDVTLDELIDLNKLGTYNTYIDSIAVDGESIEFKNLSEEELKENLDILNDILSEFSNDDLTLNIFFDKLFNYISYITIAGIAVNNFTCPKCKAKQRTDDNELIWLDPIAYFLEILDYRFTTSAKTLIR